MYGLHELLQITEKWMVQAPRRWRDGEGGDGEGAVNEGSGKTKEGLHSMERDPSTNMGGREVGSGLGHYPLYI
jgi:hypothetical protein